MMVNTVESLPATPDYPAAHSMDTTWFAVDENGEIGQFLSDENGYVPAPKGISQEKLSTPESLLEDKEYVEAFKFRDPWYLVQGEPSDPHNDSWRNMPYDPTHFFLQIPRHYHYYGAPDQGGHYHWIASPAKPLNVRDIPQDVLDRIELVPLKDYVFQSREPVNPFDHAPNAYGENVCRVFPEYEATAFPIPSRRDLWTLEDVWEANERGDDSASYFYAVDDDECIALFRTDHFGAIPRAQCHQRGKYEGDWGRELWEEMIRSTSDCSAFPKPLQLHTIAEAKTIKEVTGPDSQWPSNTPILFLVDHKCAFSGQFNTPLFVPEGKLIVVATRHHVEEFVGNSLQAGLAKRAWQDAWVSHWLEYPFFPAAPRLLGLFHYDMSWFHAGPYARIGVPEDPVHLSEFSPEWRERMNPARFEGIRFSGAKRVQPMEHVECVPGDPNSFAIGLPLAGSGWFGSAERINQSEIWIDAKLETVHLCNEDSIRREDDERLLRRARRYYEMVERLAR